MLGRWFFAMIGTFFSIMPALVYILAGSLIIGGDTNVSIGTIVAFTTLQSRIFFPLGQMLNVQIEIQGALALFDRIFEYLEMPHEITDAPNAVALDPARMGGGVVIDGVAVRRIRLDSLGRSIGVVTQETYLFHSSVVDNLRYARPEATMEAIEAASRAAAIHDRILELPEGYDTVVGERGYKLSGGEKQRVAIARVLLKNPRVLVLDEATSSLDSQSEALIQAALERLMVGRTSIVIAHRLSTILAAEDRKSTRLNSSH